MDRFKFSSIAHRDHALCSPVGDAKLDRVLGLLALSPDERVLDVGCGKAEVLLRLIERYGVRGKGVDLSAAFLAEAAARASARVDPSRLELREQDAAALATDPGGYDLALCIGGPWRLNSPTLHDLLRLVRPGGQLLVGDAFWLRTPEPAYLEATGIPADDLLDHAGNVAAGVAAGLTLLYTAAASEDEWDHYEGLYLRAIERYAVENAADPDVPAMLDRIHRWRDAYFRWGRETLGFGLYLFRR